MSPSTSLTKTQGRSRFSVTNRASSRSRTLASTLGHRPFVHSTDPTPSSPFKVTLSAPNKRNQQNTDYYSSSKKPAYKSQSSYNFKPTQLRKAHPVQSETRKSFSTRGNINGTLAPKARGFAPSSTPVRTSSATKCEYNREESLLAKGDGYQQKQQVRGRKKSDGSYQMSLLEQKKQQWAKEREELNGLWSPWGRPSQTNNNNNPEPSSQNGTKKMDVNPSNVVSSSYVTGLGLASKMSSSIAYTHSDVYLPPISGADNVHQSARRTTNPAATTTSWAMSTSNMTNMNVANNNNNNEILRKSSLPNRPSYHQPQHMSRRESHPNFGSYPNNAYAVNEEEEQAHFGGYHHAEENNNNSNARRYMGDTEDYNIMLERGTSRSPGRVIVHKIYMDGRGDSQEEFDQNEAHFLHHQQQQMQTSMTVTPGPSGDNMSSMKQRGFGGSMGYIGLPGKPPPPAMRSSLTIGLDPSYANSLKEIEKQEREQWLNELEKQREEQRMRKLMEKDDKRARWGDRGIGVGHFWEPSDSSTARLPATPNSGPTGGNNSGGQTATGTSPTPPAWLERSLTRMQSSKSQPNLTQEAIQNMMMMDDNRIGEIEAYIGGPGTTNRFINHQSSTTDLRTETPTDSSRTFVRGQNNVPPDPNTEFGMEKRRQANQEHLEAVKKQIEDRQLKLKEEKEKRIEEEKEHEVRMAQQRELELKRMEMEKRRRAGRGNADHDENVDPNSNNVEPTEKDNRQMSMRQREYSSSAATSEQLSEELLPPPRHESPLIPHQIDEQLPDAYELEIARRQSLLVGSNSNNSVSLKTSSMVDLSSSSTTSKMIDQCLMTDTDHIYERTLTPTKERRSVSLGRSEFGTQTEQDDLTTGDSSAGNNKNRRSRSKRQTANCTDGEEFSNNSKPKEKPRWGANPVKKQYLKQSEKDPHYMQRMRQQRNSNNNSSNSRSSNYGKLRHMADSTGTGTDDSEETARQGNNNIPFSRIRTRKSSKSPNKKASSSGPLKALHPSSKTEQNQPVHHQEIKSRKNSASLLRNFPSDTQLNSLVPKARSGMPGIVRKNLGSISGLNSVGGSEESGSGFTSPSLGPRSGGSDSLRSVASPSHGHAAVQEYIPSFSKEFIPMRDFDEIPISAGKIAPGFQRSLEDRLGVDDKVPSKKLTVKSTPKKQQHVEHKGKNKNKTKQFHHDELPGEVPHEQSSPQQRLQSPPVPALLKKLQMGFQPDESGRISSLPTEFPEILTPVPPVKIGTPNSSSNHFPTIIDSRLSSAEPKLDIDIALTSSSNPDLQRLLQAVKEQERLLRESVTTASSTGTGTSRKSSREEEDEEELSVSSPEEHVIKLPDILPDPFPPLEILTSRTLDSEVSFRLQDDFIRDLMSQREVQEQLSAREHELSEKGIIEFNVRLPSRWSSSGRGRGPTGGRTLGSRGNSRNSAQLLEEYKDPLSTERQRATATWLRNLEDDDIDPSNHSSAGPILHNLSAMKQELFLLEQRKRLAAVETGGSVTDEKQL